jgi:2-phosphosulfolactate phosphatase
MPTLHVVLYKEALDATLTQNKIVIVLDILFATSTIVHAFGEGIERIWPALDQKDATLIASSLDGPLLAGEYLGEPIPGFGPATPLGGSRKNYKDLVYCSTNGTVALRRSVGAKQIYVGALLNGSALVKHIVKTYPDESVLLVCSGSVGQFNLEDFYGAGHLVAHFNELADYDLSDAARAAGLLYQGTDADTVLNTSRVGRMMKRVDLQHEIDHAAQRDVVDVVARLEGPRLIRVPKT